MFLRPDRVKIDPDAVIEALENPHDRQILAVTQASAQPAQEIIEQTDIPKSTAYRRIQRLQEMGLLVVESGAIKGSHPVERFRACVEMATLSVENGDVQANWRLLATSPEERLFGLWDQMAGA